ncbi:MAG: hypothetical protein MJZ20_12565 [Bacteroidaceae bacterium]|nr:hypothetical protein [Bacteroidaceae bacterium]
MGRPKKDTTTEAVVDGETIIEETAEDKNARLEAELAELKAQMALLIKANAQNVSVPTAPQKEKSIPFINMTDGKICLRGTRQWKLEGRFAKRMFLEKEARVIIANMPNAISSGIVYIADADFVKENDLEASYANILTDEQLKSLLKKDADVIVEAYKNTSDAQKDIIIGMITDMRMAGEKVDANVLFEIGKLSGRDLVSIEKRDDA